jgi:S-adenosylmethionine synthetase
MITVERLTGKAAGEQPVEAVERKGAGHPDTIVDSISEAVSVALSKEYRSRFGSVLHHNIDKGLLAAGRARKAFWGGKVLKPMELYIGDRATFEARGVKVPVAEIAVETARQWIRENLRFVNPDRHVKYKVVLAPGSAQLADIYLRKGRLKGANDTSAAIGYWPLSPTEEVVLSLEKFLNGKGFKHRFPETGEDVKVMAVRRGRDLVLTLAMPLVDRFLRHEAEYFVRKEMVLEEMGRFLDGYRVRFGLLDVHLNNLDERGRDEEGIYVSVTGTSAEDADSGSVGRGNRVNGLITFCRPMSLEAAAGKNPVGHVGKIFNVLSHLMARRICEEVEGISEAYVLLVSRIGVTIDTPQAASAKVRLAKGAGLRDVSAKIREVIERELSQKSMLAFTKALAEGKYPVC